MAKSLSCIGVLGLALLVVGCESNQGPDMAAAPPPDSSLVITPPPAPEPILTEVETVTFDKQPTPDTGIGSGSSYTVQKGDTLWSISKLAYGTGQKWQSVASANGITDPSKLRIGQTIVLP